MRKTISVGLVLLAFSLAPSARADSGAGFALKASFAGASSAFLGYSVAIDGDTAVVGAINDDGGKGAARVYLRTGTSWAEQQVLRLPSGAGGDQLGYSVAVSGDTAIVGSTATHDVQVFVHSGSSWTLASPIHDPDPAPGSNDCFGCAIAFHRDTVVVGAPGKANSAGRAYVFARQGGAWQAVQTFSGQPGEAFGFSVALSPDAVTALVGAFGASSDAGLAYLFHQSGETWSAPQPPLAAPDGVAQDRFGYAVALDNDLALVGAYGNAGHGAAYLFARNGGTWSWLSPKLVAADAAANDFFGISVALSGNVALVGAYLKAGPLGPGAAYAFTKTASGSWSLGSQQELLASGTGQYFGYAVAVGGNTAVVGAFGAPDGSGFSNAGAAYMFASALSVPALGPRWTLIALIALLAGCGSIALRKFPKVETKPKRTIRCP